MNYNMTVLESSRRLMRGHHNVIGYLHETVYVSTERQHGVLEYQPGRYMVIGLSGLEEATHENALERATSDLIGVMIRAGFVGVSGLEWLELARQLVLADEEKQDEPEQDEPEE